MNNIALNQVSMFFINRIKYILQLVTAFLLIIYSLASWAKANTTKIPAGFVKTKLAPYNGYIAKPDNWFFHSQQTKSGWMWTVSKEKMIENQGFYETGLRIQTFENMDEKSKESLIQSFIKNKKTSTTIVKECTPVFELNYEKQCLETKEKAKNKHGSFTRYHILYSILWIKEHQLLTITTFGTPEPDWEKNETILNTMSRFSLSGDIPDVPKTPNQEKNNYIAKNAHVDSIILLQPDEVLKQRIKDIKLFSEYVQTINQSVDQNLDTFSDKIKRSGYLAVAIRPDGRSNAWTDFYPALSSTQSGKFINLVKDIPVYRPQKGTVVFAIKYNFWNSKPTPKSLNPKAWQQTAKGQSAEITDLVDTLWK